MILLDTNVLSELMKPAPEPAIIQWLDAQLDSQIFLTAITAMVGAGFILTDPIFQGLAISLLFGLASSTILTVLVIPAIYVVLRDDRIAS